MAKPKYPNEYFCVAVRRKYETVWRMVGQYATRDEAEAELNNRRAYTGSFNYDNAELRVISRTEAKVEFGKDWEYAPIGGAKPAPRRVKASIDDF